MKKIRNFGFFLTMLTFFIIASPVRSEFTCQEGMQDSGSIYRICLPEDVPYNGKLAI